MLKILYRNIIYRFREAMSIFLEGGCIASVGSFVPETKPPATKKESILSCT
jgi:hypothetical protein